MGPEHVTRTPRKRSFLSIKTGLPGTVFRAVHSRLPIALPVHPLTHSPVIAGGDVEAGRLERDGGAVDSGLRARARLGAAQQVAPRLRLPVWL